MALYMVYRIRYSTRLKIMMSKKLNIQSLAVILAVAGALSLIIYAGI